MPRSTEDYLIWSNEHRAWWGVARWGYVRDVDVAGRYSREEAISICQDALPSASHVGVISEVPVRVADLEEVLKDVIVPKAIRGGD